MKFQNCILINFVTDAWTNARTHARTDALMDGQAESNMPFQLFPSWGHKKSNIQSVTFAISFVTMNGHTYILFKNILNDVQTKGKGEINMA